MNAYGFLEFLNISSNLTPVLFLNHRHFSNNNFLKGEFNLHLQLSAVIGLSTIAYSCILFYLKLLSGVLFGKWAAPFKIHTPPVEDFGKVYLRGQWEFEIFKYTYLMCDFFFYVRFISEGVNKCQMSLSA